MSGTILKNVEVVLKRKRSPATALASDKRTLTETKSLICFVVLQCSLSRFWFNII